MFDGLLSTQGIVLRSIPFREYDQILSVFTLEGGLIKIFYKGKRRCRKGGQNGVVPLTLVEVVYRERRGEIFSCHELAVLETFSLLRKELLFLHVACDLLQVVLDSQWMGKSAPRLYALLCFYLKKIPFAPNPWVLSASFRLKLLVHDGILSLPFICSVCERHLKEVVFISGDERRCVEHRLPDAVRWSFEELSVVYRMTYAQSCREIFQNEISVELREKIFIFFDHCVGI